MNGADLRRLSWITFMLAGMALGMRANPALADDAAATGPAAPAPHAAAEATPTIVVTGSYLRRTDTETPSPVQVIGAEEIEKSGKQTISDVIRGVSADNSGTLTQNFSGALAGGASGVSLRGLTLDATLVLMDGHRLAPYPLADDGQRPFVDLSSLPLGMVERVEILKDGASATYGSDAIAGVVNIILRKQFTGLEVSGDLGGSYRLDGLSQRGDVLWGFGDLDHDGHNVYFNLEYHHQASISQQNRDSYLSDLNLTQYGGPDRRGGVVQQSYPNNGTFIAPGMVAPQNSFANGDTNAGYFALPGCQKQNVVPPSASLGGCIWNINLYNKIQPRTEGLDLSGRWTQNFTGTWSNVLTASWFDSQAEQYRQSDAYSTGPVTVPYTWVGSAGTLIDQTNPANTTIVLPATHPDNPFNPKSPYFGLAAAYYGANFKNYIGQPALFYGVLTDFPDQQIKFNTDVIRVADDLMATLGGWDLDLGVGFIHDETRETFYGFIRNSLLSAALASDTYRVGASAYLNSPSLYASLAPVTSATATSSLGYVSLTASRTLLQLPGGPLGFAFGLQGHRLENNNPGEPYAPQGDIIMDGSFYAYGSQTVGAAFMELSAPVLRNLEVDLAGRMDHYNSPSNTAFTPKVGLKWTVIPQVALRGTYAKGFRAPGIAEASYSGTGSATTAPVDPARCPYTKKPSDCGFGYAATLSVADPSLLPETSRSYTMGIVLEPWQQMSFTFDYYNIRRDNEIVPAPFGLEQPVRGPPQYGPTYPGGVLPGPIVYYPQPYLNAAKSTTSGYDGAAHLKVPLGATRGDLTFSLDVNYVIELDQTFYDPTNGTTIYRYAGTAGPTAVGGAVGTPNTRGSFTTDWTRGPLSLGAIVNYRGNMKGIDESTSGDSCLQLSPANLHCYIASFTYVDAYGQYTLNDHLQLSTAITNVTNRLPPLNTVTYGGFNYNPSLDQAGAVGRYYTIGFRYRF